MHYHVTTSLGELCVTVRKLPSGNTVEVKLYLEVVGTPYQRAEYFQPDFSPEDTTEFLTSFVREIETSILEEARYATYLH